MSLQISDLEKWILSDLSIRQIQQELAGKGWDEATTNVKNVMLYAPPSLLPASNQGEEVFRLFQHLTSLGLTYPKDKTVSDLTRFIITTNGIGTFRKYLVPARIVRDKKTYNGLIDKIDGNPDLKKELKSLGDKLRNKLEDEAIDGFIKFALKAGSDSLIYYIHLIPH